MPVFGLLALLIFGVGDNVRMAQSYDMKTCTTVGNTSGRVCQAK